MRGKCWSCCGYCGNKTHSLSVEIVDHSKHLGLTLDTKLRFYQHTQDIQRRSQQFPSVIMKLQVHHVAPVASYCQSIPFTAPPAPSTYWLSPTGPNSHTSPEQPVKITALPTPKPFTKNTISPTALWTQIRDAQMQNGPLWERNPTWGTPVPWGYLESGR